MKARGKILGVFEGLSPRERKRRRLEKKRKRKEKTKNRKMTDIRRRESFE